MLIRQWAGWNLGKEPVTGNVVDPGDWRPPVPTPLYSIPPVPSWTMANPTVMDQIKGRAA